MPVRPIFYDSFTDPFGVKLNVHKPDIGVGWTRLIGTSSNQLEIYTDGELSRGGYLLNDAVLYRADCSSAPSKNYVVRIRVVERNNSSSYKLFLVVRMQDANNFYALEFGSASFQIWKKEAGVWSALSSNAGSVANGNIVELHANDGLLSGYKNGALITSVNDTTFMTPGSAGFGVGALRLASDDVDFKADDFYVSNLETSAPIVHNLPQVDFSHPLANGLIFACPITADVKASGRVFDLVTGQAGQVLNFAGNEQVATEYGPALDFERNNNDRINFGHNDAWGISGNQVTIEALVKPESLELSGIVDYVGGTENYSMLFSGSSFYMQYIAGGTFRQPFAANFWPIGEWVHAVVTMEKTASSTWTLKFYRNGRLHTTTTSWFALPSSSTDNLYIGYYGAGSTGNYDGLIRDVKIWNRALSADEVSRLYQDPFTIYREQLDDGEGVAAGGIPAQVTKSLRYTVGPKASVAKALAYVVSAKRSVTKSLRYAVRKPMAALTKSMAYVTKFKTAITKSLRYAARKKSPITKSLRYTAKARAAITKSLQYVSRQRVSVAKSLKYVVPAKASVTKSLKYGVTIVQPALAKSLQYSIALGGSLTKSLQYIVTRGTGITKSLRYVVPAKTAMAVSLAYSILKRPSLTKSLSYVLTAVSKKLTKSMRYTTFARPSMTKALRYSIFRRGTFTKALNYSVGQGLAITAPLKYVVLAAKATTKPLTYSVPAGATTMQKSMAYAVSARVAVTKALQYTVTTVATAITKSLKYTVTGAPVSVAKDLQYVIAQFGSITAPMTYEVTVKRAITKSLRYAIRLGTPLTKAMQYIVKQRASVTRSLTYAVLKRPSLTKALGYYVRLRPAMTKSLRYAVKPVTALMQTLTYVTTVKVPVTKALKYTVLSGQVGLQRAMKYTLLAPARVTKTLWYIISTQTRRMELVQTYTVLTETWLTRAMKYYTLPRRSRQTAVPGAERVSVTTTEPDVVVVPGADRHSQPTIGE